MTLSSLARQFKIDLPTGQAQRAAGAKILAKKASQVVVYKDVGGTWCLGRLIGVLSGAEVTSERARLGNSIVSAKHSEFVWLEYEDGVGFTIVPTAVDAVVDTVLANSLYFIRDDVKDYEATRLFGDFLQNFADSDAGRWVCCEKCKRWKLVGQDLYLAARSADHFQCSDIPGNDMGCQQPLVAEEQRFAPLQPTRKDKKRQRTN